MQESKKLGLPTFGLCLAVLMPHAPVAAADPNLEYFREYEEAYLDTCARVRSRAECQCLMEASQASLTFERFARLVASGWETLTSDGDYVAVTERAGCLLPQPVRKAGEDTVIPVAQHRQD